MEVPIHSRSAELVLCEFPAVVSSVQLTDFLM